eukprot:TRINITY_DN3333_c0_g1_i3.p1 TRINITY_DN3333_c0_g1~~TRINITY_DN3333_c0_g1_i3.p1  ORF type:complete len:402 (+),score=12.69 TRINITY_DN3333_c0_g1_i3:292-1497(+)
MAAAVASMGQWPSDTCFPPDGVVVSAVAASAVEASSDAAGVCAVGVNNGTSIAATDIDTAIQWLEEDDSWLMGGNWGAAVTGNGGFVMGNDDVMIGNCGVTIGNGGYMIGNDGAPLENECISTDADGCLLGDRAGCIHRNDASVEMGSGLATDNESLVWGTGNPAVSLHFGGLVPAAGICHEFPHTPHFSISHATTTAPAADAATVDAEATATASARATSLGHVAAAATVAADTSNQSYLQQQPPWGEPSLLSQHSQRDCSGSSAAPADSPSVKARQHQPAPPAALHQRTGGLQPLTHCTPPLKTPGLHLTAQGIRLTAGRGIRPTDMRLWVAGGVGGKGAVELASSAAVRVARKRKGPENSELMPDRAKGAGADADASKPCESQILPRSAQEKARRHRIA